ncbi:MAG: acyl-CoA synthetase [Bacteroidota bacterium]
MNPTNPFTIGLDKNPANYVPLSPLTFIERSAAVHPHHVAVVDGTHRYTWAESFARCKCLASALQRLGIQEGNTVSIMAHNCHEMFEAHFGIPVLGAVIHAINTRLDASNIAFMLDHAASKVLIADREFSSVIREALDQMKGPKPLVVDIDSPQATSGDRIGEMTYEDLLASGTIDFPWTPPRDEWQAIALGYTSGTTGNPKGVVTHHRGAYLNAISNLLAWDMPRHSVYLWTLPMFHCNGWCFPWTLAAISGTNVCLRKVDTEKIYELIEKEGVTHYCGAPIVHNWMVGASPDLRSKKQHKVQGMVAAAPPPAALLASMEENNFQITHVYGLTETYGPAVVCEPHKEWEKLPIGNKARMNARQGVRYHMLEALIVADPETLEPVPADGETIGEILFKGNNVMMGYFKNPEATENAFRGGWFHSGDLGVMHPDGYIQIRDRSKDIIISGGENISSIEVQDVLYMHPAIQAAGVVACPDTKWGETPCAFIELKPGNESLTAADVISFCREHMATFKVPKHVVFGELPKTSTGKIQKFKLREMAKEHAV